MSNLLDQARNWVSSKYGNAEHLLKTESWLQQIHPDASEAMLIASVTHDMERAFPGPDSPEINPSLGPDDPVYNQAHSQRSARFVSSFLREQQAPKLLVNKVAALVRAHEIGGWHEANWVQAADSLSFLEVNVTLFLDRMDISQNGWNADYVQAKFDWMYHRIQIEQAKIAALPLYQSALTRLADKRKGL